MVEDGERMTALRQSSPFAGILEPSERWAVYARFVPASGPDAGEKEAGEKNDG
jgi:hypothetical protein